MTVCEEFQAYTLRSLVCFHMSPFAFDIAMRTFPSLHTHPEHMLSQVEQSCIVNYRWKQRLPSQPRHLQLVKTPS